ncbi:Por secretion system C-terminal sorting domain-containing protein [Saccharicrinis carchari]|uniref:Por secretion system C-terminal sorting domain-containing protein n=1 Tax=Saccharicrinis carchari TaxID=1168039 RepID=A0A521D2D7_SACCC|nr:T9SS type A sorting domain-containing protein [Saccharicrinis carchari]SMO65060.1 Por secretion system C-terminal sorting domain-containing protein [Saccharicrinis carchari]
MLGIKNYKYFDVKMRLLFIFFSVIVLNPSIHGQVGKLVWEDNFNQGQLDLSKWSYETGTGVNGDWGTGQLDRATDKIENISFQNNVPGADDGCLVITTRKEFYIDRNYTSGRVISADKASWGPGHRIVAKVFPKDIKHKGQGFAFWMMPDEIPEGWDYIMWPQGGEIDIMEYVGSIPYHNLGSVHYAWFWENNQWQSWNHGHKGFYYSYETGQVPNPCEPEYGGYPPPENEPNAGSTGFHTYGIDWYKDKIEFFVNDYVYHIHYLNDGGAFRVDGQDEDAINIIDGSRVGVSEYSNHFEEWNPFQHKMYAILSAGVGGQDYTYGGSIIPEAEFPCSVFIDWVKVYELDNTLGLNAEGNNMEFNTFPNPSNGILKIQISTPKEYTFKIIDLSGKTIIHNVFFQSSEIDVSDLKKGMYLVLINNDNYSISKKIVIEE